MKNVLIMVSNCQNKWNSSKKYQVFVQEFNPICEMVFRNQVNSEHIISYIIGYQQLANMQHVLYRLAMQSVYNIKFAKEMYLEKFQTESMSNVLQQESNHQKNKLLVQRTSIFPLEAKKQQIKAFSPNANGNSNCKFSFLGKYKEFVSPPPSIFKIEQKSINNSRSMMNKKLSVFKEKMNHIQQLYLTGKSSKQENVKKQSKAKSAILNHNNFEKIPHKNKKKGSYSSIKTKVSFSEDSQSNIPEINSIEGLGLKLGTSLIIPEIESQKTLIINGRKQHFQIIKFINQGCYGKVHLVRNIKTNFIFCLKTLKKEGMSDEIKAQIVREIKIQSFLSHPNIVAMYGFAYDSENIYLLLEPCLGGNLFDLIKKKEETITGKMVTGAVREVCHALQYMHRLDVIHRDIKPENILLHYSTIKICDFGWAVHSPLLRQTCCGTPIYLSPEVLCSKLYDNKVDVWAIGILTYELLCKKIPFQIKAVEDLSKIMNENINFENVQVLSKQTKDFISKCLSKNPHHRPRIIQLLDHPFLDRQTRRFRQTYD